MVVRSGRFGKFIACSNYPTCKTTSGLAGMKCPVDGGDIVGADRRGQVLGMRNTPMPLCRGTNLLTRNAKCGAAFLVEKWDKAGNVFHLCANKNAIIKQGQEEATAAAG
jgi:DNA topoisomerase-1